jgi:FimV-like protein
MGQLAVLRRQPAEARAEFEAALRSDQNFGPAQLDLAETLLESGDVDRALPWIERAAQSPQPAVAQQAKQLAAQIHSSR